VAKTSNYVSAANVKTQLAGLDFLAFMRNKHPICSPKDTFEAIITVSPIAKTDSLLIFTLNGQPIKSKNGRAYFDLPIGTASDKPKRLKTTATLQNPATLQSISLKDNIEYQVSSAR
jgi:hypothetical protein